MANRLTRKAVLAGLAAAAAATVPARAAAPSAKIERDALGRIVGWTGPDGVRYAVEYRTDFPPFRLADYPGVAAYAFKHVTATGRDGVRTARFSGFAWGPDRKAESAPNHATAGAPARGVFVQNGFDSAEAIARAARGRLRALHLWTEQDFLAGVADALKLNAL
ncbi:MAG: hypothetical protein K2Q06_02475 [Parvularculaceae bacterium]|nr:hypothetical protein [Parvularculaceae bacterium]